MVVAWQGNTRKYALCSPVSFRTARSRANKARVSHDSSLGMRPQYRTLNMCSLLCLLVRYMVCEFPPRARQTYA